MKRIVIAVLAASIAAPAASAARVEFRGGLCVLSVAPTCTAMQETSVGFCYQMRYSPPNVGTNGPATNLSILEYGGAQNYRLPSGSIIGTAYQAVAGTGVYRLGFTFTSQMRITSQSPANLSTAAVATITGDIKDFDFLPGCNVKFRGSGPRHEF